MAKTPKRLYAGETMERMWTLLNDSDSIAQFSKKFDEWREKASWPELIQGYDAVQRLAEADIDGSMAGAKTVVFLQGTMTREQWLAQYAPKELGSVVDAEIVAQPESTEKGDA